MFGTRRNDPLNDLLGGASSPMLGGDSMIAEVKKALFPDIDKAEALARQQRNMDALIEAHEIITEGQHEVFKQAMSLMQQATGAGIDAYNDVKGRNLDEDGLKRASAEIAQATFDRQKAAEATLREAARGYEQKAMDVLNARYRESLGEV